jgi:hypothetical protein
VAAAARARWAVLALAVVLLLEPALFHDQVVVGRDLLRQFYPRGAVFGEALAAGHIPRWNPWSFHGTPWWGPRAGGVLYPGYLLFALLPLGKAMAWFVALHLVLAFAGARRLCARDTPGAAADAAGLAYALGGFVSSMFWALPYLVSAALLPWAVLGARRMARDDSRSSGGALVGAVVGLDLLVGDPQGAMVTGLLALVVALREATPASRRRVLSGVALAGFLGVAGGGLVLTSILAELPTSDRSLSGWEDARYGLYPLAQLGDFLVPGVWGHTAQHVGGYWGAPRWGGELPWCGLGVGALGVAALLASRSSPQRTAWQEAAAWVVVGLALVVLDAGAWLGLRYAPKWFVLTALGLARGVGLGFAVLERDPSRARRPLLVLTGSALALAALVLSAGDRTGTWLAEQGAGVVVRGGAPARDALLTALLRAGLCAGLALGLCWRRRSIRAFRSLGLALLALDLLTAAQPLLLFAPASTLDPPALADTLHRVNQPPGAPPRYAPKEVFYRHPELDLMAFPQRERFRVETLRPNLSYAYGVRSVRAFESVRPAILQQLIQDPGFLGLPLLEQAALLDGQFVLLAPGDTPVRRGDVVAELSPTPDDPALWVVRNPHCPPWAYLSPAAEPAESLDDARRRLLAHVGAGVVLGPEGAPEQADAPDSPTGRVLEVSFAPERVALRVHADAPCWLVVRDAFDPGWRADRDGLPATIARADLLYRAVRVPPGEHEVVFVYEPAWWRTGLGLTVLGWLALLAWWLLGAGRGGRG